MLAESTSKCCLSEDSRPLILAHIEDEIRLNKWLRRQWQITRFKVSVTEPCNSVKQAQEAEGRQLAPTSVSSLVGWLAHKHLYKRSKAVSHVEVSSLHSQGSKQLLVSKE